MKAIVLTRYGPAEALQLREVTKPSPKEDEVLIKIHAVTVHTGDCEIRRFKIIILFWLFLRLKLGIFKPRKNTILGQEVAGEIEAVGARVSEFKPGDAVIAETGLAFSGYAQYVCLPVTNPIILKPASMTWEQATAIPVGGSNALHFLRAANIKAGQTILIYGSSGSIGTMAIQLAKYYGAEVTAVCSSAKAALVKSLGADHVIDYHKEDFSERNERYDFVFETIGKCRLARCLTAAANNGTVMLANPTAWELCTAKWKSIVGRKKIIVSFADNSKADLNFLKQLIDSGKLTTVIDDNRFTLEQAVDAHRYVEQGHKTGNIVLNVTG